MKLTTEEADYRMSKVQEVIKDVRMMTMDFCGKNMPVNVNLDKIVQLADEMKNSEKLKFDANEDLNHAQTILVELLASSINYCFWYGKYSFKPAGSTDVYSIITDSVLRNPDGMLDHNFVNSIIDELIFRRFPLIEERTKHLLETSLGAQEFLMYVIMNKQNAPLVLYELIRRYPGFASDMFLKRAFLFVICLNRKLGYFKETIKDIPVPADYQVPKMLRHFGCLVYSDELANKVDNHTILPKTSLEEISIRAGTVYACEHLVKLTGWTVSDVDSWLWLKRKECNEPFHLTITTDY